MQQHLTPATASAVPIPPAATASSATASTATATTTTTTSAAIGSLTAATSGEGPHFLERLRVWASASTTATGGGGVAATTLAAPPALSAATAPAHVQQQQPPVSTAASTGSLVGMSSTGSITGTLVHPSSNTMMTSSGTAAPAASVSTAGPVSFPDALDSSAAAAAVATTSPKLDLKTIIHNLEPSAPLAQRLKVLKDLSDAVKVQHIDDPVQLWTAVETMTELSVPAEARQVAYYFLADIIDGQSEYLTDIQRALFYQSVANKGSLGMTDLYPRIRIIRKLTKEGREVASLDKGLCGLLLSWLSLLTIDSAKRKTPSKEANAIYLILIGLVKVNFALLEENDVVDMIVATCSVCLKATTNDDVYNSLALMDVVVRYAYVPFSSLDVFVQTLCHTVNVERFTQSSWTIVRNLFRSHCAHNTIQILCNTLEDPKHKESGSLLRGAVFFIGMASWSSQRINSLIHSFVSVLPSLYAAVMYQIVVVDLEVILSVHRLVKKYGKELSAVEWDIILDMLILWRRYVRDRQSTVANVQSIVSKYDSMISQLYEYYASGRFGGSAERYFDLLSMLGDQLDETMTLHLLTFRAEEIHPVSQSWVDDWDNLMSTFFSNESRTLVRFRALTLLASMYYSTRVVHGAQLVTRVIIPYLIGSATSAGVRTKLLEESQAEVANMAVDLVTQIILTDYDLDEATTEKLLQGVIGCVQSPIEATSLNAITNLTLIFEASLYWNTSSYCLSIFDEIIKTIGIFGMFVSVRQHVLATLLRLRAVEPGRIYILDAGGHYKRSALQKSDPTTAAPEPSPTSPAPPIALVSTAGSVATITGKVDTQPGRSVLEHGSPSPYIGVQVSAIRDASGLLPISSYLSAVVVLLKNVQPYDLVYPFLSSLPAQLANKAMFSNAAAQIRELLLAVMEGVLQNSLQDRVNNWPANSTRKPSDMYLLACQLLTVLLGYKHLFTKAQQDDMILCFEKGVAKLGNTAKTSIHALNLCSVELPLSMQKLLSPILAKFSQIASNPTMSVHILEFLSALIQAPELHVNFSEMDYKRIFGIALQHITSEAAVASRASAAASVPSQPQGSAAASDKAARPTIITSASTMTTQHAMYIRDLAHRVLCVWFIGLRVSERRKYVSFISKGLLNAFEPFRNNNNNVVPEQVELILDMLARHSYAACQTKPTRSFAAERLLENSTSKFWAYGTSVLEISSTGSGWSEVTLRRPTGTAAWLCRLENRPVVTHEADYVSLPATLMMHLPGSTQPFQLTSAGADHQDQPATTRDKVGAPDGATRGRSSSVNEEPFPSIVIQSAAITIPGPPDSQVVEEPSGSMEDLSASSGKDLLDKLRIRSKTFSGGHMSIARQKRRTSSPNIEPLTAIHAANVLADPTMSTSSSSAQQQPPLERRHTGSYRPAQRDTYILPSFQFLQMLMYPGASVVTPVPLKEGEATTRALKNLDRIPAVDFHKIGVIYVGPGQSTEPEILGNSHGSPKYSQFISSLGKLLLLKDCKDVYTGGLDIENGVDGEFAYYWQDHITQMIFHVATLMPSNEWFMKKRHIGNDYVTIVYNDSGDDYRFGTLASQFDYINIVVKPLDEDTVQVSMLSKNDLPDFSPLVTPKVVSTKSAPIFVRQVALHANHMASLHGPNEYVSNFLSRARQIRRIGERFSELNKTESGSSGAANSAPTTNYAEAAGMNVVHEIADFTLYS